MSLFNSISLTNTESAICGAVTAFSRVWGESVSPRSACEVGQDAHDYQWLCSWGHQLSPNTIRWWLNHPYWSRAPLEVVVAGVSRQEAIGLVLLLAMAEIGRREASEGQIWPAIRRVFQAETQTALFVQGHPTQQVKDAIEAACHRFNLRHVFGKQGVQAYYVSIYLQFGFTRDGLGRLPYWLTGHPSTEAIRYLLGHDDRELESESFQLLWNALRDYRGGNITEHRVREVIAHNPWVLPEWSDALVRMVRERLSLSAPTVGVDDAQSTSLIDPPVLRWRPPDHPQFVTRLIAVDNQDLSADRYALTVNAVPVAAVLRREDGTYAEPGDILIPCDSPRAVIALTGPDDLLAANMVIDLWDEQDDVAVYELQSGRAIDPWQYTMSTAKSYLLLTTHDLVVDPAPIVWLLVGKGTKRLSLLQAGWSSNLRVLLEGEVLWAPYLAPRSRLAPSEPDWVRWVRVHYPGPKSLRVGGCLTPIVSGLADDVALRFVRLGKQPLDFEQNGSIARVDRVVVTPDIATSKPTYTLGLQRGTERVTVRRQVDPPIDTTGTLRLGAQGWEAFPPNAPLTVHDAAIDHFRLLPARGPSGATGEDAVLVEGPTFVRRLGHMSGPLGPLAGLGARLQIRDSAYNAHENLLTVAERVIDPGVIRSIDYMHGGMLLIKLRSDLHLGRGHRIVCWSVGQPAQFIPRGKVMAADSTTLLVEAKRMDTERLMVAIAFEGYRLGAWWPQGLDAVLPSVDARVLPSYVVEEIAALMRWMHTPVLSDGYAGALRAFVSAHPAETMAAWLLDDSLPEGLRYGSTGEAWHTALRCLLATWQPTGTDARLIIETISRDTLDDPLLASVPRLARVDPLLMGRIVRGWLRAVIPNDPTQVPVVEQLRQLKRVICGLSTDATEALVRERQKELLGQAASAMQVDTQFLDVGIVQRAVQTLHDAPLVALDAANLNAALAVAPFRDFLGLRVLDVIARQAREGWA